MTKPTKKAPIYCQHCGTDIMPSAVKACLRKTCETKKLLEQREAYAA